MPYSHIYVLYDQSNHVLGYHLSFKKLLHEIAKRFPNDITCIHVPGYDTMKNCCVQVGLTVTPASKSKTMYLDHLDHPTWDIYVIDPSEEHITDVSFEIQNTGERYIEPMYKMFQIKQYEKYGDS